MGRFEDVVRRLGLALGGGIVAVCLADALDVSWLRFRLYLPWWLGIGVGLLLFFGLRRTPRP